MNTTQKSKHNYTLDLEQTIYLTEQLEVKPLAQVAFAGRSNVGKSSLINCLAQRTKKLAKVSSTPGKTRSLNFYRVRNHDIYLVDLPGYGYARCSKTERAKWAQLVDQYFINSSAYVTGVALLLDCRLTPQQNDLDLSAYIQGLSLPIIPVLTKADKCKQGERAARVKEWTALLSGNKPILFSSKTGMGRDALWQRLMQDVPTYEAD